MYIGKPAGSSGKWDDINTFTKITPAVYPAAVQVVNPTTAPVNTKEVTSGTGG